MTCKKPSFPTYEEAAAAALNKTEEGNFALASTPRYNRYRAYQCSNCRGFHITRNLKTIRKHRDRNLKAGLIVQI